MDKNWPFPNTDIKNLLDTTITCIIQSVEGLSINEIFAIVFPGVIKNNAFDKLLEAALREIKSRGYIFAEDIVPHDQGIPTTKYFISASGLLFCRKPILWFRGKPFTYEIVASRATKIAKIIWTVALSLATLIISIIALSKA